MMQDRSKSTLSLPLSLSLPVSCSRLGQISPAPWSLSLPPLSPDLLLVAWLTPPRGRATGYRHEPQDPSILQHNRESKMALLTPPSGPTATYPSLLGRKRGQNGLAHSFKRMRNRVPPHTPCVPLVTVTARRPRFCQCDYDSLSPPCHSNRQTLTEIWFKG